MGSELLIFVQNLFVRTFIHNDAKDSKRKCCLVYVGSVSLFTKLLFLFFLSVIQYYQRIIRGTAARQAIYLLNTKTLRGGSIDNQWIIICSILVLCQNKFKPILAGNENMEKPYDLSSLLLGYLFQKQSGHSIFNSLLVAWKRNQTPSFLSDIN